MSNINNTGTQQPTPRRRVIRATPDSIGRVSQKLDKRIRQACRTYYPDGSLTIGKIGYNEPLARRISQYTPNNPAYPAVVICSTGDNVIDFGSLHPQTKHGKPREYFDKIKAELIRQHNAGEFKYWD